MRAALRSLFVALVGAATVACGGTLSVLHARGKPTGDGPAHVVVQNSSGVVIEKLYVAKAADVAQARAKGVAPDSEEDVALWGTDQLDNAGLGEGKTFDALTLPGDRYDVLVVDHDHREQMVEHLRLAPGGKYVLEIGDAWAQARR